MCVCVGVYPCVGVFGCASVRLYVCVCVCVCVCLLIPSSELFYKF